MKIRQRLPDFHGTVADERVLIGRVDREWEDRLREQQGRNLQRIEQWKRRRDAYLKRYPAREPEDMAQVAMSDRKP